ncbi:MAG TPA: aquaporin [Candidatus Polarisedimenticolaceae bacterium]|nr:aquaporin [Candidatus Polarisedimenticolaceae bacterium]
MQSLRRHWPEYLMEAAGLGIFMMVAAAVGTLLEHPASPLRQAVVDPLHRRLLMGLAMGGTAIALIYSPWGQQSGAHLNPSVTLTFHRLGRIAHHDAVFYVLFQFLGGLAGMLVAAFVLRQRLAVPEVRYVATLPGVSGRVAAFAAEVGISFCLMFVVLLLTNTPRLARFAGVAAGTLVSLYIAFEAPISGMSMNPARSLASALPARIWEAQWIYFLAPPLGMLLAAQAYLGLGRAKVRCAKLHHDNARRCIFRCGYAATEGR